MNIAQMHADGRNARIAELEAEVAALRRDRERLDWLEGEFQREHDWMMTAQWGGNPCPKSLFRKNEPITREAIDAARAAETAAA